MWAKSYESWLTVDKAIAIIEGYLILEHGLLIYLCIVVYLCCTIRSTSESNVLFFLS